MDVCFLCGRNGSGDPLDRHHLFGGAYREKSERLGLTVRLCHERCHIFGENAAHRSAETMQALHEYGQRLAMERMGWSEEEFRAAFGKSYLAPSAASRQLPHGAGEPSPSGSVCVMGFALLPDDAALPF